MEIVKIPATVKNPKRALVGYIRESYTLPPEHPNFFGHSNYQECRALVQALTENGYSCDLINWDDDARALIGSNYDVFFSIYGQLEYGKSLVKKNGRVIYYATGCHWLFQNYAEYERLHQLKNRRGYALMPRRTVSGIAFEDQLDEIWYFGNDFQLNTYSHAKAEKHRIQVSIVPSSHPPKTLFPHDNSKHFLWFSSAGSVHKGLDWLLDIFPKHPELHLHICGLVELEKDFYSAFRKELLETPNIHFHGWVLPNSEQFRQITSKCGFVVSPSCSEGCSGATLQCMSMGLVPLISKENGIDTRDFGYTLKENTIEETEKMILELSQLKTSELEQRSLSAQQYIQENHLLEKYKTVITERIKALSLQLDLTDSTEEPAPAPKLETEASPKKAKFAFLRKIFA